MQAILDADYSFTPVEYWASVSQPARDFINRCLTVDPTKRLSAHAALEHPWLASPTPATPQDKAGPDLLPHVRKNFNARVKLNAAIDTIRAINQLRAGQGQRVMEAARKAQQLHPHAKPGDEADGMEGVEGQGQLGQDMEIDAR